MGEGQDTAQDTAQDVTQGVTQGVTQDRVTIQEAARRLGVKEDAIRKRIQRRSMRYEKAEDGRVYVWVDATQDESQDTTETAQDATQDTTPSERLDDLKEQVGYLRRQVEEERESRRRADTIIAQLSAANAEQARTIRELEAPQEPPEDAETIEESPEEADAHFAAEEARAQLVAERALRQMAEATLRDGISEERRRREEAERERDGLRIQLNARSRQQETQEVAEQQSRGQPQSAAGVAQESVQRPWWRKLIGR